MGITTVFDGTVSMVSEWTMKGNAYDYVQDPRVDPSYLLLGLARALHYLHNHPSGPIFHGDVRAKNVLVSEDGRALLTGFSSSDHASAFDMSYKTLAPGAVRWMAPEGIDSTRMATAERDVWAFAMTALELFSAKPPFAEVESTRGVIVRILNGRLPGRPSTSVHLTDGWWDLCITCWNFDPALRPSMSTVKETIEAVRIL
ncbi:hypothetical protein ID866_3574 [Astraeus odoratus]|nr:hypothetical protein ID866_3574 [Astraeus odoratus]